MDAEMMIFHLHLAMKLKGQLNAQSTDRKKESVISFGTDRKIYENKRQGILL